MAGEEPGKQAEDLAALVTALERLQQDWLRGAGEVAEQVARALGSVGGQPASDGETAQAPVGAALPAADMARVAAPLLRAQALWLEGGLRYLGRLSEANGSFLGEVSRRLAASKADGLDEQTRRELNDETRAYLRRLADLSLQEARTLQHRLADVEAEVREPAPRQATATRHAKAKD